MEAISPCAWTRSQEWEDSDCWKTDCGNAWRLDDGTPSENHMSFCPFCGRKLEEEKCKP